MHDERWQRLDALFDAALELPPEQREELLDRECDDDADLRRAVERLLAVEEEARDFLAEPAATPPPRPASIRDELAGLRVGHYRLIRPLGHGGMGTVYLAQREDDYSQTVAVKLVRRSLLSGEARHRLRAERQALARLEHPNIARLYDGGTTEDGLPYLVMERVEGMPIDRYCDHHRLGVRRRLELVRDVLSAVAHAHHHLRVHCDIKPSNILVTEEGVPKLLDFGIAKLLSPEERAELTVTVTGQRPMTLGYASPEQVLGQPITTATDLYAVGILLAELLCGRLPYMVTGDPKLEMARAIVEQEPQWPSRLVREGTRSSGLWADRRELEQDTEQAMARAELRGLTPRELESRLRGDLDAIVSQAIRKEPGRRYASADTFAEDITRHLEARPVLARRGTLRYRMGRFVRRLALHPDPQRRRERWTWAAAVLLVAGFSSTALTLREGNTCQVSSARLDGVWDEGRRQEVERAFLATGLPFAEATFARVAPVLDNYADSWLDTDQEVCEATLVRGERSPRLLDLSRLCLDGRLQELRTLVDLLAGGGDYLVIEAVSAVSQLGQLEACTDQVELATQTLPPADHQARRRLEKARGVAEEQRLRLQLKLPVDLDALRQAEDEVREIGHPPLLARILMQLGLAEAYISSDPENGIEHLEEALLAAIAGGDRPQQTRIYAALIKTLSQQKGDIEQAAFWRPYAEASLAALSTGYEDLAIEVHGALGMLGWNSGEAHAAQEQYEMASQIAEEHGTLLQRIDLINQLGLFEENLGPLHQRAIQLIEQELGPSHPRLAVPLVNLAASRAYQGRYAEALPHVQRAYRVLAETHGENHLELTYAISLEAQILMADDRPEEAVDLLRRAVEVAQGFGDYSMPRRDAHVILADALVSIGSISEALEHARTAEKMVGPGVSPGHPSRLFMLRVLGSTERLAGNAERAVEVHEEMLGYLDGMREGTPGLAANYLLETARTYLAVNRRGEARELLEEGVRGVRDADAALRSQLHFELARLLASEEPSRARRLAREAAGGLDREGRPVHRALLDEIETWLET